MATFSFLSSLDQVRFPSTDPASAALAALPVLGTVLSFEKEIQDKTWTSCFWGRQIIFAPIWTFANNKRGSWIPPVTRTDYNNISSSLMLLCMMHLASSMRYRYCPFLLYDTSTSQLGAAAHALSSLVYLVCDEYTIYI